MPKILAIETATEACSVALLISDEGVEPKEISRFKLAPREHTKLILPMIEEVLKEGGCKIDDIDAIAFGRGPGAFTGLRIAAGIAQGLALSIDKPVIPVSTLSALALQAGQKYQKLKMIVAGLDARMDEVYWGVFVSENGNISLIGDEKVSKMEGVGSFLRGSDNKEFIAIGSAWDTYLLEEALEKTTQSIDVIKNAFPSAIEISRLGLQDFLLKRTVAIEEAQPVYLRNNVAVKSKKT